MAHLYAWVKYQDELHAWEPQGLTLTELTQRNPLLAAHARVLAVEFPRRRFDTQLMIAVGGLLAHKGTYFVGRDRAVGLDELARLQDARKLGLVEGAHLISKVFDHDDHQRDESTSVSVRADFSRPKWPELSSAASISVITKGPFGWRHLDELVAAAWETFGRLLDVAPVAAAIGRWTSVGDEWSFPADSSPPVGAFMMIGADRVAAAGGGQPLARRLGAHAWQVVGGDDRNGVVVQLSRRPDDMTDDRLGAMREVIRGL